MDTYLCIFCGVVVCMGLMNLPCFNLISSQSDIDFSLSCTVSNLVSSLPGCLGTAGALAYGLRAFHQGKTRQSQMLMRGRIFAQGFTVFAIIFGVVATQLKPKQ